MRAIRTAIFCALAACLFSGIGLDARQSNATDPEWIVIYELDKTPRNANDFQQVQRGEEPTLNLRVVIHSKTEGEAVMKSVLFIQNKFGVNSTEALTFIEVAPKKGDKK